jgi:hypothetical protein
MDERVFADDYIHIWMTSATFTEVVCRVADELGLPITAGEVLLMAQRLRRDGAHLPVRPGGAGQAPLTLSRQPDDDYRDDNGRTAYAVGSGTSIEGPWVCTRCRSTMCGGFILLPAHLEEHWPVCEGCVDVAD